MFSAPFHGISVENGVVEFLKPERIQFSAGNDTEPQQNIPNRSDWRS
jgi:hypothetical protein